MPDQLRAAFVREADVCDEGEVRRQLFPFAELPARQPVQDFRAGFDDRVRADRGLAAYRIPFFVLFSVSYEP